MSAASRPGPGPSGSSRRRDPTGAAGHSRTGRGRRADQRRHLSGRGRGRGARRRGHRDQRRVGWARRSADGPGRCRRRLPLDPDALARPQRRYAAAGALRRRRHRGESRAVGPGRRGAGRRRRSRRADHRPRTRVREDGRTQLGPAQPARANHRARLPGPRRRLAQVVPRPAAGRTRRHPASGGRSRGRDDGVDGVPGPTGRLGRARARCPGERRRGIDDRRRPSRRASRRRGRRVESGAR